MTTTPFISLPFFAKLAIMLVPFIIWVMFAEFVIDREGWDQFLPFYRFGEFCPYDLVVLLISGLCWFRWEKQGQVD